jgi:hypothetical protein
VGAVQGVAGVNDQAEEKHSQRCGNLSSPTRRPP